jgi:hypothetical protein
LGHLTHNFFTMKSNRLFLFVITLGSLFTQAQYTDEINTNRPGESMNAYAVGKRVLQFESGFSYSQEQYDRNAFNTEGYLVSLTTRYGFFKEELEGILEMTYQNDSYFSPAGNFHRDGFRRVLLGFKYLIYDPFKNYDAKPNLFSWKANHKFNWHMMIPAVSVYAGTNIKVGNYPFMYPGESYGTFSPKVMVISQNVFSGAWAFVTNTFVDKIASNNQTVGFIGTITKGFDRWSGFIEGKMLSGGYYSDVFMTAGAAYLWGTSFQVDAFISQNMKNTPSITYAGLGVSWRTDTYYEDNLIRAPKKEKKKEKKTKGEKKKEKEKEKLKKRLDEVPTAKP